MRCKMAQLRHETSDPRVWTQTLGSDVLCRNWAILHRINILQIYSESERNSAHDDMVCVFILKVGSRLQGLGPDGQTLMYMYLQRNRSVLARSTCKFERIDLVVDHVKLHFPWYTCTCTSRLHLGRKLLRKRSKTMLKR